ncbi:pseudouridine synthase [Shewanella sp. 4_MG-2023]|uniref:pseudouridine synthase n=1 Tax=Shewanella sp. 4_MG-2023 TaxID=3062652 RepID=UPI0026E471BD|nr:pseudouridine synthase [Shewanella sp. 4_MG-2023]MDO6677717.1 pseudouridine synthase [Shewanella sp. 4_MG-2023]
MPTDNNATHSTTNQHCFVPFNTNVDGYTLPEKFTFPFYYQPHPLAIIAAEQLQEHLQQQTDWLHNFGITDKEHDQSAPTEALLRREASKHLPAIGKMFGVLVVKNTQGQLGFLAAFSGKLADKNLWPQFVPPVFDMLSKDSFFKQENIEINQLNAQLVELENDPLLQQLTTKLALTQQQAENAIAAQRSQMIENRKYRKAQRAQAQSLNETDFKTLSIEMSRQSVNDKYCLAELKEHWERQTKLVAEPLAELEQAISAIKQQRKQLSNGLQHKLFSHYQFLNALGESSDLNKIFNDAPNHLPPAGAGECAAPKLLQYAFKHNFTPITMAEFWWGMSPKSEIKQHKNYYPACHGKCRPILGHMLKGLLVDENPLLSNPAEGVELPIVYQDDHIVIVNKPAEFLSVPGKNITDSVYSRMKQAFPHATGPLIVHRLDMSTSGLMVIALSKEANKHLVQQFISRTVTKRYIAKIDGVPQLDRGDITLPLRVDLDDRPKQLVCYLHGKNAQTHWQKVQELNNSCLIHLFPKTGRTHQLRVHCAHAKGLNMPILGDDLYGKNAQRLHLHAQLLSIIHPNTNHRITFEVNADFE